MKIVDRSLERTLETLAECNSAATGFPADHANRSYFDRYKALSDKLHADFHPNVMAGSMVVDGGVLTDHGSEHIKTVIQRASLLLDYEGIHGGAKLSPYEIYLLLTAIHFHDIGNILGRDNHAKKIDQMMDAVDSHLGDHAERKCIRNIAAAHGGEINDDKDTISYLSQSEPLYGQDVRPQLLAAILRFADELADDRLRANRILQTLRVIPKESEVYHKYASCLQSVMVRPEDKLVELCFEIHLNDLTKKFGKKIPGDTIEVHLIDEIFSRTVKMHLERMYCNRYMFPTDQYMSPIVDIREISVAIEFTKDNEHLGEQLPNIAYRLEERGYPRMDIEGLYQACPALNSWEEKAVKIDGAVLEKWAEGHLSNDAAQGGDDG
jgi:hypothetical protein